MQINKETYEKLEKIGMTREEIKEWMSLPKSESQQPVNESAADEISNVQIKMAQDPEDTIVSVEGIELRGIMKATVEYNPELPYPLLRLTIMDPKIS